MKKKLCVTKGWFSELSTTESTFHFNDERIKIVKWWRFLFFSNAMLSQLLFLAFLWLISVCTGSMISLFLPSSSIKFISRLTNNKISRTVYLLCNKKCKYPNVWRRVSSFENLRMCQYPSNNSIQSSSWTMIPLSWFPNFHILWVWTQEAESPVILQSGAIWSRDSVCVPRTRSEWITFCTCQSDKNIPRSQADCSCILWFIQARTFHVWFLNDFQFLSRAELTQKATKMFQCCYFHWNIIYLPHERI